MSYPFTSDTSGWVRLGRGHEVQFLGTTEDVQQWPLDGLPPAYSPYILVGADNCASDGSISIARSYVVRMNWPAAPTWQTAGSTGFGQYHLRQGLDSPRRSGWIPSVL